MKKSGSVLSHFNLFLTRLMLSSGLLIKDNHSDHRDAMLHYREHGEKVSDKVNGESDKVHCFDKRCKPKNSVKYLRALCG